MHIIGIDPGLTGAVACVDTDLTNVMVLAMPRLAKTIDVVVIRHIMTQWRSQIQHQRCGLHVYIEKAQPMPKQGVTSTFQTGYGYGMLIALLALEGYAYTPIAPQTWKRALGLTADKDAARARAKAMFPQVDLHKKQDHGKAEALLIAWYGRLQLVKQEGGTR